MRKALSVLVFVLFALTVASLWMTKDRPGEHMSGDTGEAAIGGAFSLTDQSGKMVSDTDFRGKLMLVTFGFTHCPDICPTTVAAMSKTLELLGDKAGQVAALFITVDPERDSPDVIKEYLANFDRRIVGLTGSQNQIKTAAGAYKAYFSKIGVPWDEGDDQKADQDTDASDIADDDAGDDDAQDYVDASDAGADDETSDDKRAAAMDDHDDGDDAQAEHDHGGNYAVDHSAFIYLMGRDGKYIRHFPYNATATEITQAIQEQLNVPAN